MFSFFFDFSKSNSCILRVDRVMKRMMVTLLPAFDDKTPPPLRPRRLALVECLRTHQ